MDAQYEFEAVQIAMTKDKNGHVLRLSIHPSDTPEVLLRDPVGTRYRVGVIKLGDDDTPVATPEQEDGAKAVRIAATLCASQEFQEWLMFSDYTEEISEEAAASWMRSKLGVTSRAELKVNALARAKLHAIVDAYRDAK